MNATKWEPTEEQRKQWAANEEQAAAKRAEEERRRSEHDALMRADKVKAAANAAAKSEVASAAASVRETRRTELVVQIAELELVVEAIDEATMARHRAALNEGQYARDALRFSVDEERVRRQLSALQSELKTLEHVAEVMKRIAVARSQVAVLPKRRELSTQIQNADDVMVILGSGFDGRGEREELWRDEDGTAVGVANTVRGSTLFIVFVSQSDWAAKGKAFFEKRRAMRIGQWLASASGRDPKSAASAFEFEQLTTARAIAEKNAATRYEQEDVMVLVGDARWDLVALYGRRRSGKLSDDLPERGEQLASLATSLTRDDRVLVRWLASLRTQIPAGSVSTWRNIASALHSRMTEDRQTMGETYPHIEAARAWWREAKKKTADAASDETKEAS